MSYEIVHYFAYGSNMNPARMQARGMNYDQLLAGQLAGFSLCFNKRAMAKQGVAYANIAYQRGGLVEGLLYRLSQPADIAVMDGFEGTPVRYSREVFVIQAGSTTINAWVYVANAALLAQGLLPESRYMEHLLAGKPWHSEGYQRRLQSQVCIESPAAVGPVSDGLIYND